MCRCTKVSGCIAHAKNDQICLVFFGGSLTLKGGDRSSAAAAS
jgi:hypothetical protein